MDVEVHELAHYWQGVAFPYIHWYAFMSLKIISEAIGALANASSDYKQWSCQIPSLRRISQKQAIQINNLNAFGEDGIRFEITELELLECYTSLIQWQIITETSAFDAATFRRWLKRNPSYHSAYDVCCKVVKSEEIAIRLFLPLVRAAFRTSRPVESFGLLLSYMNLDSSFFSTFIAQQEPCRWDELFSHILTREVDLPDANMGDFDTAQNGLLDNALGLTFGSSKLGHPILTPDTKRWLQEKESNEGFDGFLSSPRFATERNSRIHIQEIYPPSTIIRIHSPNRSRNIFMTRGVNAPSLDAHDYGEQIHSFLVFNGVIRRAAGLSLGSRLCSHQSCQHYRANFCNGYHLAPEDPKDCKFPLFLSNTIEQMNYQLSGTPKTPMLREESSWLKKNAGLLSKFLRGLRRMN